MADNVAITAGSGTSVATDDVSGVHYQRVKLVDGTLDGSDAIPGTAANGLDVDVTRLPASSTMNASSSDGGTALTNSAQAIKASAGVLTGFYIYNPNTAAVFVQFYNTAQGSVTVGTTNPLFMVTIPSSSAATVGFPCPITFGTAMSWAATSTAGGNGAPTTALDAVAFYI